MSSRKDQKARARAERLAREAKLKAEQRRKQQLRRVGALLTVVAALGVAGILLATGGGAGAVSTPSTPRLNLGPLALLGKLHSPGSPGPAGPEGVSVPGAPQLAGASTVAGSGPVDGIQCLGGEQLLFHIHAHLTVFVNGAPRQIPGGVGIQRPVVSQTPVGPYVGGGSCFFWLHTHASDGIIHIESPIERTYTLGDFFDVWGQQLGPARVGPFAGRVTALYDGHVYDGNPRDIPLTRHAQIQLEVGAPLVAPETTAFPNGL